MSAKRKDLRVTTVFGPDGREIRVYGEWDELKDLTRSPGLSRDGIKTQHPFACIHMYKVWSALTDVLDEFRDHVDLGVPMRRKG